MYNLQTSNNLFAFFLVQVTFEAKSSRVFLLACSFPFSDVYLCPCRLHLAVSDFFFPFRIIAGSEALLDVCSENEMSSLYAYVTPKFSSILNFYYGRYGFFAFDTWTIYDTVAYNITITKKASYPYSRVIAATAMFTPECMLVILINIYINQYELILHALFSFCFNYIEIVYASKYDVCVFALRMSFQLTLYVEKWKNEMHFRIARLKLRHVC